MIDVKEKQAIVDLREKIYIKREIIKDGKFKS